MNIEQTQILNDDADYTKPMIKYGIKIVPHNQYLNTGGIISKSTNNRQNRVQTVKVRK